MLYLAAGFECSVLLLIVCVTESDTMVMGSRKRGGWLIFRPTNLAPNNTLKDRQPGTWATNFVLLLKGGSDWIARAIFQHCLSSGMERTALMPQK